MSRVGGGALNESNRAVDAALVRRHVADAQNPGAAVPLERQEAEDDAVALAVIGVQDRDGLGIWIDLPLAVENPSPVGREISWW
ncbi:MAG TPA: hypothetical protein VLW52_16745 [Opitutaceae bacterium]|nr:hypothetical protein [Opitutaceae bacterium]